jgi:hypothetical protein
MPNWASNALTTTNKEIIAKLRECEAAGNEDILDAFVPMPEALKGIMSGGATAPDGTYVRLWRDGPGKEIIPVTPAEEAELIANYGTADWYNWSVENWSTKWDAAYTHFAITDDEAVVTFNTAWSPPRNWLQAVIAAHPEGRTQLAYAEGGMGFYGRDVFVDGEQVVEEFTDGNFYDSEKSWDDPEADDDPNYMLTVSARAHLETYWLGTGG